MFMIKRKGFFLTLSIVLIFGISASIGSQFFVRKPVSRYIHIRNFRYGKDPAVIRCNPFDTLHLTFSSDDTGHSFFLEEFDVDAKVSPGDSSVMIFKTSDPTLKPQVSKELVIIAKHPGVMNYLVSKSIFRCHVWCGPMHAFEQGKLIIMPNTLLFFSLGCLAGILFLWIRQVLRDDALGNSLHQEIEGKDLLAKAPVLKKFVTSRWPQIILTLLTFVMVYMVIIISVFGTKVSGRNLGVLLMWAVWLFLLIVILTPLGGRIWCTICPLPFLGDWLQRGSFFSPRKAQDGHYDTKYHGLFLKWPERLNNKWFKLITFLVLATFSTTLVASPRTSGLTILSLLILPLLLAVVFELRAFCRFLCPVSVFVGPFSLLSPVAIRNKSQQVCIDCKTHSCELGSSRGWACPWGLNVGTMDENSDCGLCLECTRSCNYNNVSLFSRPFGKVPFLTKVDEAWMAMAIFSISIIYSILYLGPWSSFRDYVNLLDKRNWHLFGSYAAVLWLVVLLIIPGLLYLAAGIGVRVSKVNHSAKNVFIKSAGSLLPLGLFLWMAFVIPMLFVNITFIRQSLSDPFGWGWNLFGEAGIPWHQFLPQWIPWFQAILVLTGLAFSLKNLGRTWQTDRLNGKNLFLMILPTGIFILSMAAGMIVFFTN